MKEYTIFIIVFFFPFFLMAQDSDGDGLDDSDEAFYGCDINDPDTDDDGLLDGEEVYTYYTDPTNDDSDYDDLDDFDEINIYNTDPNFNDSDFDDLEDGYEVNTFNTNPLVSDTDIDGLSDGDEVYVYGTDPLNDDSDFGGAKDGAEIIAGLDPLDPSDDATILGTDKYESNNKLLYIYPTVSSSKLNIYDELNRLKQIIIYNIQGQQIITTIDIKNSVDISNLTTGVYVVKLITDKSYKNIRIVKK